MYGRVPARAAAGVPAVVLVHGLGVSGRYMQPTADALAPRCRVYVPDLPGFGRSPGPRPALDIPALGDCLAAWMGAVGLSRATLVGNSLGCQVVVECAARHADRVDAVVLAAPTVDPLAATVARQLGRLALDALREPPSLLAIAALDYLRAGPARVLTTFRRALAHPIEARLGDVRAPAVVVRGERDPVVPPRWAEAAARLLPRGRLLVVPGAAHAVNYSAGRRLARIVRVVAGLTAARGALPSPHHGEGPWRHGGPAAGGWR
jgi:2-hydroxy-6-oxonona-2,4-dienedioate hydrolase